MKLLIISDIHGNIDALKAVWAAEREADQIYCAGDLTDYGVFPEQVIGWMKEHHGIAVKGNHDVHTVHIYEDTPWQQVPAHEFKWVHHTCARLGRAEIEYLKGLPETRCFEADGIGYVMCHQYDDGYGVIESRGQFEEFWRISGGSCLGSVRERRVIVGHTHRQCIHILGDLMCWLNPGSVSYRRPDDWDKEAQYIVIEDGRICLKSVPYDRSRSLEVSMQYLKKGKMMESELQDAMFFFGDAKTSREPLSDYL